MAFEDLTLVPIQTKMINAALLTASEEQWLDGYHKLVGAQHCILASFSQHVQTLKVSVDKDVNYYLDSSMFVTSKGQ
jgi:hypothetical protein